MSEHPIDVLVAEGEISAQLHLFCRAVNQLDRTLLLSVWHEGGTLDCEEPVLRGPVSELATPLLDWYAAWASQCHQITNVIIDVHRDRAVSETYAFDVLRPAGEGGALDSHRRGRYLDRWSCRDGRWALDHRQFVNSYQWSQAVLDDAEIPGG